MPFRNRAHRLLAVVGQIVHQLDDILRKVAFPGAASQRLNRRAAAAWRASEAKIDSTWI
ncbi:hypothetical protein D3C72_2559290 [compost metagenome]